MPGIENNKLDGTIIENETIKSNYVLDFEEVDFTLVSVNILINLLLLAVIVYFCIKLYNQKKNEL
jgi:large-conductance mechanosensitive channel